MLARSLLSCSLLLACGRSEAGPVGELAHGGAAGAASTEAAPAPWPGRDVVAPLEDPAQFFGNLSGLTYEPAQGDTPATLWAVSNIPGKLYRLFENSAGFAPGVGWDQGKLLRYPNGAGEADAEGVTLGGGVADGLYVVAEHDNDNAEVSRLSVLRYEPNDDAADLIATQEWDLTSLLPPFAANLGLEAITWVPDDYLTERGFVDESAGGRYEPANYPGNGGGLFLVGVEQTGVIHGFALDHDNGGAALLTSFATRYPGVVGLEHDRDVGQLWVWCDDLCGNYASVFDIDGEDSELPGRFSERAWLEHPRDLPNSNNEGIALSSERECDNGLKPFFWTDDNDVNGQSLRGGLVRCGAL